MKQSPSLLSRFTWWCKKTHPWSLVAAFTLFIAAWFRFWQLGSLPQGISWDEAYQGYVGRMVVTTGRDEFSRLAPMVFESFGDFKAPLAEYVVGLSTAVFGLTPWAVRLPFALSGMLAVILIGLLVWKKTGQSSWGLLASWLLATSPWHIHFSRIGFESGMAASGLALLLFGWYWAKEAKTSSTKLWAWGSFWLGVWIASYAYHASKIVLPLTLLSFGVSELPNWKKNWQSRWKELAVTGLIGLTGLMPFLSSLFAGGLKRGGQTLFWSVLPAETNLWSAFGERLAATISPNFWVFGATDNLRHGTSVLGVSTGALLLGLVISIGIIIATTLVSSLPKKKAVSQELSEILFWTWLTLIGLLPAILGFELYHTNRAFLAIIPFTVLATLTLRAAWSRLSGNFPQLLISSVLLLGFIQTAFFWQHLILVYPRESAAAWMEENLEASRWAGSVAGRGESLAFTKFYGQPEIFFAFANNWPVERYRVRDFGALTFVDQADLETSQARFLVSATVLKREDVTLIKVFTRTDGLPAYRVYQRAE